MTEPKPKSGGRPEKGVRRTVTFTGWCRQGRCDWHGPERDYKADAAFDVAGHEVDQHGGSWRAGGWD